LEGIVQSDALLVAFGRMHLAVLHFPVALLCVAAALELMQLRAPSEVRAAVIRVLVRFGAASAVLAAVTGWVHASEEPLGRTAATLLDRHRWLGMACALLAVAAVVMRSRARTFALGASAFLALLAGHFGGELVHGESYLSEPFRAAPTSDEPRESTTIAVTSPATAPVFADVHAVFQARCIECHGPLKQKGELRLDALDPRWFEPGEFGTLVVRGDPEASELVRRMRLPLDDDDHMPPKKKPQHGPEELALVESWIRAGAR
jgi:mono/diheme cytochrome c family protein